jgi:hypothetical protein
LTITPVVGSINGIEELLQGDKKSALAKPLEEDRTLALISRNCRNKKPDDCWSHYNLGAVLGHQNTGKKPSGFYVLYKHNRNKSPIFTGGFTLQFVGSLS